MEKCSQHDMLMQQILELGNQISALKTTLIRVVMTAVTASSAVLGVIEVVLCT